jgi:hypothetical protein
VRLRRHLNFANVTSALALFVALGGTSYAIATGSIGSREIKNNSVRGKDIRNRTITSKDVRRNGLGGTAIRESRLGQVPRSRNTDRVGGLSASQLRVHCPSGTRAVSGECVELSARPAAPYASAKVQCESGGRLLPTHQQLVALIGDPDVPLASGGELTAEVYPSGSDPGSVDVLYVKDEVGSVGVTSDTFAGRKAFRCTAHPSN